MILNFAIILDSTNLTTEKDFENMKDVITGTNQLLWKLKRRRWKYMFSVRVYYSDSNCPTNPKLGTDQEFTNITNPGMIRRRFSILKHIKSAYSFEIRCALKLLALLQSNAVDETYTSQIGIILAKQTSEEPELYIAYLSMKQSRYQPYTASKVEIADYIFANIDAETSTHSTLQQQLPTVQIISQTTLLHMTKSTTRVLTRHEIQSKSAFTTPGLNWSAAIRKRISSNTYYHWTTQLSSDYQVSLKLTKPTKTEMTLGSSDIRTTYLSFSKPQKTVAASIHNVSSVIITEKKSTDALLLTTFLFISTLSEFAEPVTTLSAISISPHIRTTRIMAPSPSTLISSSSKYSPIWFSPTSSFRFYTVNVFGSHTRMSYLVVKTSISTRYTEKSSKVKSTSHILNHPTELLTPSSSTRILSSR